jgi:LAGLIDADG endonuclease
MGSENPSGADNQQETAVPCLVLEPNWIVGFVDGEGCFSVSVHRNSMMHRHGGWQLQPVFQIYQHQDHREFLEAWSRPLAADEFVRKARGAVS